MEICVKKQCYEQAKHHRYREVDEDRVLERKCNQSRKRQEGKETDHTQAIPKAQWL